MIKNSMLQLKKGEERRLRQGHIWIYSNEVNTTATPFKNFLPGDEVTVIAYNKTVLGKAYVNPHSLIVARIFSLDSKATLDKDFFIKKIEAALTIRNQLFPEPYYRLVFGEADGLPGLVIDRFNQDFVVQINTAGIEAKKAFIIEALKTLFPNVHSILFKNDSSIRKQEGLSSYIEPALGQPPEIVSLKENGVNFEAPLMQGQKTGWFYDHRMNRARLKDYVKDAKVLDVFSYVGGWGIQASKFGAKEVTCIEVSSAAVSFIEKNAALNQVSDKVKILCDDAFDAMKALVQQKKQYNVVIIDPPAFIKRQKDQKEGLVAYQRINELALKLLAPGGVLMSCSCSMHLSNEDLMRLLQRSANNTQSTIQILERGHQGPDHPMHIAIPETDYLKMVVVRKLS